MRQEEPLRAYHCAPPKARGFLDRQGLAADNTLFGKHLGYWEEPPPWFREQTRIEETLELAELKPLHLFLPPQGAPEVLEALQAERGTDLRAVDLGSLLAAHSVVFLHGRGKLFKGRPPQQRLLSAEHLLPSLAMLELEARQAAGPLGADHAIELLVLTEHPERIPYTDRTPRPIHPARADRVRQRLKAVAQETLLSGRRTRGWRVGSALCVLAVLLCWLVLWLGEPGPLLTRWLLYGGGVLLLFALLPWREEVDRSFLGVDDGTLVFRLPGSVWSLPLASIQQLVAGDGGAPHLLLRDGKEVPLPLDGSGLEAATVAAFVQHMLAPTPAPIAPPPTPQPRLGWSDRLWAPIQRLFAGTTPWERYLADAQAAFWTEGRRRTGWSGHGAVLLLVFLLHKLFALALYVTLAALLYRVLREHRPLFVPGVLGNYGLVMAGVTPLLLLKAAGRHLWSQWGESARSWVALCDALLYLTGGFLVWWFWFRLPW